MGNEKETRRTDCVKASLRQVLARAINRKQFLILSRIACNGDGSISSTLGATSERFHIPLSTLKLNASILRKMGLISGLCGKSRTCKAY